MGSSKHNKDSHRRGRSGSRSEEWRKVVAMEPGEERDRALRDAQVAGYTALQLHNLGQASDTAVARAREDARKFGEELTVERQPLEPDFYSEEFWRGKLPGQGPVDSKPQHG